MWEMDGGLHLRLNPTIIQVQSNLSKVQLPGWAEVVYGRLHS